MSERISDDTLARLASTPWVGGCSSWEMCCELGQAMAAELQEWRRGPSDEQIEAAARYLFCCFVQVGGASATPTEHDLCKAAARGALRAAWHVGKETPQ